jgi:OOP family OmpA-OmpF porin
LRNDPTASVERTGLVLALAMLASCASPEPSAPAAPESLPAASVGSTPASATAAPPVAPNASAGTARLMPRPTAVPKPVPAAAPKKVPVPSVIASTVLFEYRGSVLAAEERAKLDREIVQRLADFSRIDSITVTGHTDRIASTRYNRRLSEWRAEAVTAHLVGKGVRKETMRTVGLGKTHPVKNCPTSKDEEALIQCLAPNRRVVVEVKGLR